MNEAQSAIPATKRIQRIQLEPYDDVVSIKDRLQFVSAGRVLLVFPGKGKILQRKLDLVLIQREATRLGLRLAIVTEDVDVAEHAQELNISAFFNVEQARTQRWKRAQNKVFVDRSDRPSDEIEYHELRDRATRLRPALNSRQLQRRKVGRGIIFGVAILALLFGLYAAVPSATVRITPARDQLSVTIPLLADPNIQSPIPEKLTVPAEVQSFIRDATVTIETTGQRNAENSLAEGIITLTNETGLATFVPVGTIVQTLTSPAVQFETIEETALPAQQGSTVDVRIRATEGSSGVKGNVGGSTITRVFGPLAGSVSVINYNPTYGGGVRSTFFATEEDLARLEEQTREQLIANAENYLLLTLEEGVNFYVPTSVKIIEELNFIYDPLPTEPAETISLTIQARVEATVINISEARLVAFANLGNYVSTGRLLDERSLDFRRGEILQVLEDGRVAFQMRVEGATAVNLDADKIKTQIAGMSAKEAKAFLEHEYILDPSNPPEIDTGPAFYNQMPIIPSRIQVEIID